MKDIIQRATLRIPKGMKNAVSISTAFSIDMLIRNENIISKERKTKSVWNNLPCRISYKPSKLGG